MKSKLYPAPTTNPFASTFLGNDQPVGIKGYVHDEIPPPAKKAFKAEPARARCFKILLDSGDRQAGSTLTAAKFKVDLPQDFQNRKLNLLVDTWMVSVAPNSIVNLASYPYYVRIQELHAPYTYSLHGGGEILLTTGNSFHNMSPRDAGGYTMVDPTLFDRPITIEVISPHFDTAATGGLTNPWSIQLSLYDDVVE